MLREVLAEWALNASTLSLSLSQWLRGLSERIGGVTVVTDFGRDKVGLDFDEVLPPTLADMLRNYAVDQHTTPKVVVCEALAAYLGCA